MILNKLTLQNYRNYKLATFVFGKGVNVICGENGRGKTNILESIYMLSGNRSWRTGTNSDLILYDQQRADIKAEIESRERLFCFNIGIEKKQKSTVTINDVRVVKKRDMSNVVRCVLFSPEDLFLVKGEPQFRRSFMDNCLCQLSARYQKSLNNYEKLLKGKQKILREGTDYSYLQSINLQLAQYSIDVIDARRRMCTALEKHAQAFHQQMTNKKETLTLRYKTIPYADKELSRDEIGELVYKRFMDSYDAEIAAHTTLVGIQRDDIEIFINGNEAKKFASQGQARTAAISLKFAERELLREDEDYPIMLLDDVLSELDMARQQFILSNTINGQTIITGCVKPEIRFKGTKHIKIPNKFLYKPQKPKEQKSSSDPVISQVKKPGRQAKREKKFEQSSNDSKEP